MKISSINNNTSFGVLKVFPGKSSNPDVAYRAIQEIIEKFKPERPLDNLIDGAILVFLRNTNHEDHSKLILREAGVQAVQYSDKLWRRDPQASKEFLKGINLVI